MNEPLLREDEALFTRDLDGQLLRMDAPTREMLEADPFDVIVDGQPVAVRAAVPLTDAQGAVMHDAAGLVIPRLTTVLDAVIERYRDLPGPAAVPVLCHVEHMAPAAVCRICSVQVATPGRDGKVGRPDPKLAPACYQPVVAGMVVDTMHSPDAKAAERVRAAVKVLVEMLAADHLHPGAHPANELEALAERFKVGVPRFKRQKRYNETAGSSGDGKADSPFDATSPWFVVDRTACVLCDRCIRGCGEVRGHFIVARAGKGREARIAFDWNSAMGKSNCVQCGECFISCPTDAITMKPGVKPSPWDYDETEAPKPTPAPNPARSWLFGLLRREKDDQ